MKIWMTIVGLALSSHWIHAGEHDCTSALTEASPASEYLIHFESAAASATSELTDDVEKKYAAAYEAFAARDLMPFLERNFPSAVDRIGLFAYPSERSVIVVFPDDRTPIIAAVKGFENVKLHAADKVKVHPRTENFSEPDRRPSDEPSEYRDFLLVYHSSLLHQDGTEAFEALSADFIARDLKPWLSQRFPDLADKIEVTPFPQISSVNLRFPTVAIPSLNAVKTIEAVLLQTVGGVEVFNGP